MPHTEWLSDLGLTGQSEVMSVYFARNRLIGHSRFRLVAVSPVITVVVIYVHTIIYGLIFSVQMSE